MFCSGTTWVKIITILNKGSKLHAGGLRLVNEESFRGGLCGHSPLKDVHCWSSELLLVDMWKQKQNYTSFKELSSNKRYIRPFWYRTTVTLELCDFSYAEKLQQY